MHLKQFEIPIIVQFKYYLLLISGFLILCCQNEVNTKRVQSLPIKEQQPVVYDYDTTAWTDIGLMDTSIVLDLKYATSNNFVKEKMYACGRCFLRPEVAKRIWSAHKKLQQQGYKLKMFDCYRPKPIQEKLWKKVPNPNYVTPPWKGSMHNRGAAVDLTIIDENGKELDMGSLYDFFGQEAHHTYTKHPNKINANRKLLKDLMESLDLKPIRTEWWHYSYQEKRYEISEMQWTCPN